MTTNLKITMRLALVMTALTAFSSNAMAVGTTGCGLGSMIFTRNSFVSQTFAATTNITGLAYSLTTGTSNCKVDGFIMTDQEKAYYVESNRRHLEEEMAQGRGENLSAFAGMFGCDQTLIPAFGNMTKTNYEEIFPSKNATPNEVLESVKKQIKADPVLSQQCYFIT